MDDMYNNNGNNYGNGGYDNNYGGYDNSGYNNSSSGNGYFPDGEFKGMYNENDNMGPVQKGAGLAIAAFVISIINIVPCCTMLSIISVPLCLIFAIVSLAGRRKGKGFAITAIILSLLAGLMFAYYGYMAYKLGPDYMYFITNSDQIVADYEEDGTIPERFEKYRDPKYDKYWEKSGCKSFDDFFDKFVESYKNNNHIGSVPDTANDDDGKDKDQLSRQYIPVFSY